MHMTILMLQQRKAVDFGLGQRGKNLAIFDPFHVVSRNGLHESRDT